MENEHIRFYVLTRFKVGINAIDIRREFCADWGESCVSYLAGANWFHTYSLNSPNLAYLCQIATLRYK